MIIKIRFRQGLRSAVVGSAFLLLPVFGGQNLVYAQDSASSDGASVFEEITVTARKREESLYDAPVAMSAFSRDSIDARNVKTLDDIGKYVPNLNITRFGIGNVSHAAIFIRGIGLQDHIITTDPGVGLYVDGVYIGRQMGANMNLSNVERVEVLRGPQGTLYGRNTIGGAVNIITQKPGDVQGSRLNLVGGSRGRFAANFYAAFELTDDLDMSVMAATDRRDGVGKALRIVEKVKDIGELSESSARVALDWHASEKVDILFAFDAVQGDNGTSPSTVDIIPGGTGFTTDPSDPFGVFGPEGPLTQDDLPSDPYDSNSGQANLFATSHKGFGASLTADITHSDTWSTRLIGSFRSSEYVGGFDDDAVFSDFESFPEKGDADQYSIEAQLSGQFDRLNVIGGLYFFNEEGNTFSGITTFIGHGDSFDINQETQSTAAYVHAEYEIADNLELSGGLRYTRDEKDADAFFTNFPWFLPAPDGNGDGAPGSAQRVFRSDDWAEPTWNASLNYGISDEVNIYGSISRGYQNGGYPARPFGGPDQFAAFDPTFATNYEIGVKGTVGNWLQLYLAVFHTEYDDLALQFSDPSVAGFVTITANAGESESTGIEVENTIRFSDAFSIQSTIGYIDSEVTQVNDGVIGVGEGDIPALTPEWTVSVAPQYGVDLQSGNSLSFRMDYSYRSEMFGQTINLDINRLESRELYGFNIAYHNDLQDWTLSLYGKNIFDEKYAVARLDQAFAGFVDVVLSNDRSEFGLTFSKNFGL
jgi:iron complex outermembrane receptor protein